MQEDKQQECKLTESESWLSIRSDLDKCTFSNSFWLKLRIVSEHTAVYSYYYSSRAAIKLEKKRQIELQKTLLIHPFSHLRFLWETFMIFVYLVSFFIVPFEACNIFFGHLNPENFMTSLGPIMIIMHSLFLLDMFLHFITGYEDSIVKRINLNSKAIAINYLKTYFIIDFLSTIPALINIFPMYFGSGKAVCEKIIILNLLKLIRVLTYSKYIDKLLLRYRLHRNAWIQITRFGFKSIFFFHWCACAAFMLPFTYQNVSIYTNNSWLHIASCQLDTLSVVELYMLSIFNAINNTLTCTVANQAITVYDFMQTIFFSLVGMLYMAWLYVQLLYIIRIKLEPETKYDEFITQLHDYNRHNQLPANVQSRMHMFYEYRYQRTYFKEDAIMDTLSVHISKDIHNYCCRELIPKVKIFNELPAEVHIEIIENLTGKIFLPKDVITKAGTVAKYIYFVSYGTLAAYTISGKEVCHLWDGNYFGDEPLLMKGHKHLTNVVAIEISEVYQLDREIFVRSFSSNLVAYKDMINKTKERIKKIRAIEATHKKTFDISSSASQSQTKISELDLMLQH